MVHHGCDTWARDPQGQDLLRPLRCIDVANARLLFMGKSAHLMNISHALAHSECVAFFHNIAAHSSESLHSRLGRCAPRAKY